MGLYCEELFCFITNFHLQVSVQKINDTEDLATGQLAENVIRCWKRGGQRLKLHSL